MGGKREGDSIVIGVNPSDLTGSWLTKGNFLNPNSSLEAVIGDSIAKTMYTPDMGKKIFFSDPLVQSIKFQNTNFRKSESQSIRFEKHAWECGRILF